MKNLAQSVLGNITDFGIAFIHLLEMLLPNPTGHNFKNLIFIIFLQNFIYVYTYLIGRWVGR